ncbi:MAG: phosphoribosylformylglycinamidine synthase subunit PurS [Longimonas sp.]|uniref:phosphoribosylformylglycinamidine synthase subunit PurS n=1 Tax=Longimonas sp. TaxID=2039626 RepID=UPI003361948E
MTYHATISVTLRPSILDPEGKAVHQALQNLGQTSIANVRVGKRFEMDIEADTESEAYRIAETACENVLANPVMENYAIEVEAPAGISA